MTDEGVTSAENRCKGPRLVSQSFTLGSHSLNAIDESLIFFLTRRRGTGSCIPMGLRRHWWGSRGGFLLVGGNWKDEPSETSPGRNPC